MFSITLLGSGSAGNCAIVQTGDCKLLIDGGLSARQIVTRLAALNILPAQLDGILLTHEHIDHVGGLRVFCKKNEIPIYCNPLTAEAIRTPEFAFHKNWRLFNTGSDFSLKDLTIQTFPVPHDAADPVGFVIHHETESLGFCTDLGFATKLVFERIKDVQTLVIETNHDEKLLQNDTHRPWAIKQRIMSRHGHLSNAAAAEVLAELLGNRLRRSILVHLSRDCNSPELATETVRARLNAPDVEIFCASQTVVSPQFPISKI